MRRTIAALALISLAGCKTPIEATIYTGDVVSVAKTGTAIETNAIISLPAGSKEQCAERGPTLATALAAGFAKAEFIECRTAEFDTYADMRVTLPIVPAKTEPTTALQIEAGISDNRTGIIMRRNDAKIDAIKAALPDDVRLFADQAKQVQITVIIQNDGAEPARVGMQGAFIDGKPYQLEHMTEVARRASLKITLSDVGNAALMDKGALLFWLE